MKLVLLASLLISASLLWGCSKKTDPRNGFLGGNGICQAGQIQTSTGQCLPQMGCPNGQGWNGTNCIGGSLVPPNFSYAGPSDKFANTLTITNRDGFSNFLEKVGGVCDFSGFYYFTLFGPNPYDCDTYNRQGYLTIEFFHDENQIPNNTNGAASAYATIGAGSNSPIDSRYSYNDPSLSVPLNMMAHPINNNTGTELVLQGSFFGGSHATVSIKIEGADPHSDDSLQAVISHDGVPFARAYLQRQ